MQRLEVEVLDTSKDDFQGDIESMSAALRATGSGLSQRMFVMDSAGDSGGAIQLAQMSIPVVTAVIGAFSGWFAARAGRKVRLKIGDIEAEAGSVKEVERLIEIADERGKAAPTPEA